MTCQTFYKANSFEVFTCNFFLGAFSVSQNVLWTPSKLIARLGKEINNESSYLYWAYKVIMRPNFKGSCCSLYYSVSDLNLFRN